MAGKTGVGGVAAIGASIGPWKISQLVWSFRMKEIVKRRGKEMQEELCEVKTRKEKRGS